MWVPDQSTHETGRPSQGFASCFDRAWSFLGEASRDGRLMRGATIALICLHLNSVHSLRSNVYLACMDLPAPPGCACSAWALGHSSDGRTSREPRSHCAARLAVPAAPLYAASSSTKAPNTAERTPASRRFANTCSTCEVLRLATTLSPSSSADVHKLDSAKGASLILSANSLGQCCD